MIKALTTKTRLWALTAAVFTLSLLSGASLAASDAHARVASNAPEDATPASGAPTAEGAVEPAYEGITATGVLERQGITAYQYGTHAITDEASGTRYALRSYLDLDGYVGQRVTVTGTPVDGGPVYLEVTKVEPAEADYTAPTVNQVSPQGTRVSPRANVTATFSEAMNAQTFTTNTFTLKRKGAAYPVSATVSYDDAGEKAILDPSHKLRRGAVYIATIRGGMCGVKDEAGNPLAANEIWGFRVRT
jgi:hypothetical protein